MKLPPVKKFSSAIALLQPFAFSTADSAPPAGLGATSDIMASLELWSPTDRQCAYPAQDAASGYKIFQSVNLIRQIGFIDQGARWRGSRDRSCLVRRGLASEIKARYRPVSQFPPCWRRSRLRIFPLAFLGKESRKKMRLGTLKPAIRCAQWDTTSS